MNILAVKGRKKVNAHFVLLLPSTFVELLGEQLNESENVGDDINRW